MHTFFDLIHETVFLLPMHIGDIRVPVCNEMTHKKNFMELQ